MATVDNSEVNSQYSALNHFLKGTALTSGRLLAGRERVAGAFKRTIASRPFVVVQEGPDHV